MRLLYFSNTLFLLPLCFGIIGVLLGYLGGKHPAKEINDFYGYRSKLAKSSQERWDFAQIYSARKALQYGVYMLLFSLVGLFIEVKDNVGGIISLLLLFVSIVAVVWQTENAIKLNRPSIF